ncbi:hypothetical protein LY78DRAFT_143588 [Colletotrichum sublineola]|nr:hypothetical protein LY78DRAFT_143588 [Colletotrichum sublineola]
MGLAGSYAMQCNAMQCVAAGDGACVSWTGCLNLSRLLALIDRGRSSWEGGRGRALGFSSLGKGKAMRPILWEICFLLFGVSVALEQKSKIRRGKERGSVCVCECVCGTLTSRYGWLLVLA